MASNNQKKNWRWRPRNKTKLDYAMCHQVKIKEHKIDIVVKEL
ncbi:hypothetical protein COLO4_11987 [Corchorus olitorius]|uniref:Uncharacterized protein n=1 Tax=Corchorus olitorius TaxID=93759 RepID=A0A1R3K2J6_9ROSI|nr:hypothetical protein COLO4_11987 [Corchorus olitorius]